MWEKKSIKCLNWLRILNHTHGMWINQNIFILCMLPLSQLSEYFAKIRKLKKKELKRTFYSLPYLGHKWRAHRKLIAPTFHLNVLKSFIELFNDNSRLVCNKMRALKGETFDCHDYMSECTVEILLGEYHNFLHLFWPSNEPVLANINSFYVSHEIWKLSLVAKVQLP